MKHALLSLTLILTPAIALAWAPYEQQSFEQQMEDRQMDYSAPVTADMARDPAMVPLALVDGYDGEPSSDTIMPLDAD